MGLGGRVSGWPVFTGALGALAGAVEAAPIEVEGASFLELFDDLVRAFIADGEAGWCCGSGAGGGRKAGGGGAGGVKLDEFHAGGQWTQTALVW